jgi:hypothetical protein
MQQRQIKRDEPNLRSDAGVAFCSSRVCTYISGDTARVAQIGIYSRAAARADDKQQAGERESGFFNPLSASAPRNPRCSAAFGLYNSDSFISHAYVW